MNRNLKKSGLRQEVAVTHWYLHWLADMYISTNHINPPAIWSRKHPEPETSQVHISGPWEGNPWVAGGFLSQRARNADLWCFFDINQNKLLNKYSRARWSEKTWRSRDITEMSWTYTMYVNNNAHYPLCIYGTLKIYSQIIKFWYIIQINKCVL